MMDMRIYKEIIKLIGKDVKNMVMTLTCFLVGLIVGMFCFFSFYLGSKVFDKINKEMDDRSADALLIGAIGGVFSMMDY